MTLGDLNIPQMPPKDHQVTHTPQKLVYAAFQMQYHKPKQPVDPRRNETTQENYIRMIN